MSSSLVEYGLGRLRPLCAALGFGDRRQTIEDLFCTLLMPWGRRSLDEPASWCSDVGDDHTPFEFSVGFSSASELRILVEPLDPEQPSLAANARVARSKLEQIASRYRVDLSRLDKIWDLFVPECPQGRFSVWIGVMFSAKGDPGFKVYFNPDARGRTPVLAPALIDDALGRLGFSGVWPFLGRTLGRRGRLLDEFKYFSLDLSTSAESRIKVYARHRSATLEDLVAATRAVPWYPRKDLLAFLRRMNPDAGLGSLVFDRRGVQTCFSFIEGRPLPTQVTTHFPINSYAGDDEDVRDRVLSCMSNFGLPSERYASAIEAFKCRPLAKGIGMHSYVSLRCQEDRKKRITIYLPVEAYRPGSVSTLGPIAPPRTTKEILDTFTRNHPIAVHPFFTRLKKVASDGPPWAEFFGELWSPMAGTLSRLLMQALPRFEDEVVRERLLEWAAELHQDARDLRAGEIKVDDASISVWLERLFSSAQEEDVDPFVGAVAVCASFRQQIWAFMQETCTALGIEKSGVESPVQVSSAIGEFEEILERMPDADPRLVWRGASDVSTAIDRCLDDLYERCFEGVEEELQAVGLVSA